MIVRTIPAHQMSGNDICEACNEPAFDGTRCTECGSRSMEWIQYGALIPRERVSWDISEDGQSGRFAA